ncbi:MAG: glycosyltransferase family 4 protein, partial [Fibrobacterota bacterium]
RSLARISESGFALNKPVHIIPYPLYRTGKTLRETRETTVLFAGRDEKRKGTGLIREFGFLLKQKAPEYVLKVCGEFGRQNGTKEGNIIFTGPLGSENLRTEYRRASVFLFLSSWDNFPNVVIEAMQNGCIVLSFKNGGAEEMIEDKKSGYLYDRNRLGEMAQKAVEIMKHPEDFENIRKNALTRIESVCDPAKFAKKTLEQVK